MEAQPAPAADGLSSPPPLELVEFELALSHQDCLALGFQGAVRWALSRTGGQLLFQMRLDGMEDCDWLAAVSLDGADEPVLALVMQREAAGSLHVESVRDSELPIAGIVSSYAGLLAMLGPRPAADA